MVSTKWKHTLESEINHRVEIEKIFKSMYKKLNKHLNCEGLYQKKNIYSIR